MPTPWKEIVSSLPVWANLIAYCGQNWGYWMLVSTMPIYFSHVLNLNINNSGLFSALPYLLQCIFIILMSWIDDFIKMKHLLSLGTSRKIFNSIAHWGGAVVLVALPLTTSTPAALTFLTLAIALNAGVFSGIVANHVDLSPNFAGVLMGFTNGFGGLTSILGPTVTGLIVQDQASHRKWMIAFFISAAFFFFGNLFFVAFGSAEVQPWNEPKGKGGVKVHRGIVQRGTSNKDSSQCLPHNIIGYENI